MNYTTLIEQVKESHFTSDQDLSHWEFYCFRDITVAIAVHGVFNDWLNIEYKIISPSNLCLFHGDEFQTRYSGMDAVIELLDYIESDWFRDYFLNDLLDYQLQWFKSSQADQLFNDSATVSDSIDVGDFNFYREDHNQEIQKVLKKVN